MMLLKICFDLTVFLLLSTRQPKNASFGGNKFTVDYQVPIFPPSESALIMFQEVRSLTRVLDTVLAVISPFADRSDSEAGDSLVVHLHWLRLACCEKRG